VTTSERTREKKTRRKEGEEITRAGLSELKNELALALRERAMSIGGNLPK